MHQFGSVICQQTPPESAYTSNNKYIPNKKSKEKQHVTSGIQTRTSGFPNRVPRVQFWASMADVVEPVAPDLQSNVTTDIRPGVIRPSIALARNARGPGSVPDRGMLFFFAFLVGYIFIILGVSTFWRRLLIFNVTHVVVYYWFCYVWAKKKCLVASKLLYNRWLQMLQKISFC